MSQKPEGSPIDTQVKEPISKKRTLFYGTPAGALALATGLFLGAKYSPPQHDAPTAPTPTPPTLYEPQPVLPPNSFETQETNKITTEDGVVIDNPGIWGSENLKLFEDSLNKLPKQLFQPIGEGAKVHFDYNIDSTLQLEAISSDFSDPNVVNLSSYEFNEDSPNPVGYLAKVLTERNIAATIDDKGNSPVFTKFNTALGADWFDLSYGMEHIINNKLYEDLFNGSQFVGVYAKQLPKDEKDFYLTIYGSLGVDPQGGVSVVSPEDFIATSAYYYVEGEDKFVAQYEQFLTSDQADKLYGFMKTNIFQGKEY